ncbi:carboxymuconolactone decarboxylase family protein [Fulvivirgaceae bacterium BMA12]|uniref:Carboxymuconolactone decarboxylase family protein n=1 Tax=Agaribacillus aureus TaxID=3051825 RepID=A0ABT8LEQ0_9BACT|nr:carboxymuconolactone decarboxylase family protein [Fulvivirgaceae bacterium BMA12]
MERITYQDIPGDIFKNLMQIENLINQSSIGIHLLELIRLRVGQLNGCAYCVDMHHKELKHLGETDLRLSSLVVWKETPYFTEKERAVLDFTEVLTRLDADSIPDRIFDPLLAFFSKAEISYLTLAIAQINTWTRLMKSFRFTPGNYQVNSHSGAA